ncbi:MAG: metallophosphoesterase family protein [Candidatus Omnitrophica bacterium]|nr:metallophosphoesterase family protein [Candidatus Omnitrophota bacterium]
MRYAILSDIHSNLEALSAVLDHLASERIDRYLCLGDAVGYGADPEACLGRLRACRAVSVCGNHEWACLGKLDVRWLNEAARTAILWTRDRLGFSDLDVLRRWPLVATEEAVTLVHGSLSHPDRFEYLVDLAQAVDTAKACRTAYCVVGHTHVPVVFEYDCSTRQPARILSSAGELAEVRLAQPADGMRYVINPGSVGQPRDGDPRASFAILDTQAGTLTVRRVAYDIAGAQRKIREAGLPELLAHRLAVGR